MALNREERIVSLCEQKAKHLLEIYELTLELNRSVDRGDDPGEILQTMEETVKARKEKLDALTRLEKEIILLGSESGDGGAGAPAHKRETIAALLKNIHTLDAGIEEKCRRVQGDLSAQIQQMRNSQKVYRGYLPRAQDASSGTRIDTRK